MKKVLALSGSPRKGDSYKVVKLLIEHMQEYGDVELEFVTIRKFKIEYCRGCLACMRKGEDHCPLKDDVPMIREKMCNADAVLFVSPVYVHSITAPIKNLFDRMAYYLHRPCFHDKQAMLISTTELSGLKEALHHLKFPVKAMGFNLVDEIGVIAPAFNEPGPYREKMLVNIRHAAEKLYGQMSVDETAKPSMADVVFFNKIRTKIQMHKDRFPADYQYWQDKNWFGADYFVPSKINLLYKMIGKLPVRMIKIVLRRKLGPEVYSKFVGLDAGNA